MVVFISNVHFFCQNCCDGTAHLGSPTDAISRGQREPMSWFHHQCHNQMLAGRHNSHVMSLGGLPQGSQLCAAPTLRSTSRKRNHQKLAPPHVSKSVRQGPFNCLSTKFYALIQLSSPFRLQNARNEEFPAALMSPILNPNWLPKNQWKSKMLNKFHFTTLHYFKLERQFIARHTKPW